MALGDKYNGDIKGALWSTGIKVGKDMARISFVDLQSNPANIVTGNTINITVNGNVLAIPFNTSNKQTIEDFKAVLEGEAVISEVNILNFQKLLVTGQSNSTALVFTDYSVSGGTNDIAILIESESDINEIPMLIVSPVGFVFPWSPVQEFTSDVATTSGSVDEGAWSLDFLTSSDFVGTINGASFPASAALHLQARQGAKLPAVDYTISAGNIRIDNLT